MLRSERAIKVDSITISGDDAERLKNLCELMEGLAQTVIDMIDGEPNIIAQVQNTVTFCRNVLREFK